MGDSLGATHDVGCEGRQGQQPGQGGGGEARFALLLERTLARTDDELGGERPAREGPGDPQGESPARHCVGLPNCLMYFD